MLTFKNPYLDQRNLHQTTINVMEANPIPPRKLVPWLPQEIEAITLKAMAKDLSVRYQTMDDFKADINRYQRGEPVVAQPPSLLTKVKRYSNRHWPTIVISLLVSLFTAVLVFLIYNQSRKEQSHWRSAFESSFDDPSAISEWSFSNDSEWVFKEGALCGSSNSMSYAILKKRFNRDLRIECDVSADNKDLFNAGIFIYGDNPDSGYSIYLNKDARSIHGISFPGSKFIFYDAEPARVPFATKNHLVIERERNFLLVQLNGVTVVRLWDLFPRISRNHDRIGFFVNESSARFDNLKILRMAIPQIPGPGTSADRFRECGNFEAAIDEYNELILDFPDAPFRHNIKLKLADCLIRSERYDEAVNMLADLENGNTNDYMNAKLLLLRSVLYNKSGSAEAYDSVVTILSKKFPESPENQSAMVYTLLKCTNYLQQKQPLAAHNELRAMMGHYKFYPQRWGKVYLELLGYYEKLNNLVQVQTVAQEILTSFSTESGIAVRATIAMGNALLSLGKKEMARDVFDRCTAVYPNTGGVWNAWLRLAEIYEYDNRPKDALRIYQKVFNECPKSVPESWFAALKAGELQSGSISAADSIFAIVANSEQPFPQCRLIANYYLNRITYNEFAARWLSLFPNDKTYLYYAAVNASMKKNNTAARRYFLELKNSLNKKSWRYFQVTKILSNLS
ncbi:MAG: tetratricopeptide repeat protein [Fibrobacter sp.]|nr:tetratricopeptide repeat protein [Fibrobacter sp.]